MVPSTFKMLTANFQLNHAEIEAKKWFCDKYQISNMPNYIMNSDSLTLPAVGFFGDLTSGGGALSPPPPPLNDLNIVDTSFDAVWIEVKNEKRTNIVCGCLCRHPNIEIENGIDNVSKNLVKINKENKDCNLAGDFNIDLLKHDTNNKDTEFLSF